MQNHEEGTMDPLKWAKKSLSILEEGPSFKTITHKTVKSTCFNPLVDPNNLYETHMKEI